MSALDGAIDSPNFDTFKLIKKERLKRLNRFKDKNTRWDSIYPVRGTCLSIDTGGERQFKCMRRRTVAFCSLSGFVFIAFLHKCVVHASAPSVGSDESNRFNSSFNFS